MSTPTPTIPRTTVPSSTQVAGAFASAETRGEAALAIASEALSGLGEFTVNLSAPQVGMGLTPVVSSFVVPPLPARPTMDEFRVDDLPPVPKYEPPTLDLAGEPPAFEKDAPELDFGTKPTFQFKDPPSKLPEVIPIEIEKPPSLDFPELPKFEQLKLPSPPTIITHEFSKASTPKKPQENAPAADEMFDFELVRYSSDLLDSVVETVSTLLKGGMGLPEDIEQIIFDRSKSREDISSQRAVSQALDEWAARGHSLPSGVIDRRLRQVRQENREAVANINRDLTIDAANKEIENLRFAIQQGVALESILAQLHYQAEQMEMEVMRTTVQFALEAYRAKLELFNAEIRLFATEMEEYANNIRAELGKVELFRAQLEGEKLKGEINDQRVRLYISEVQGLEYLVKVYMGRVQNATAVAQLNESNARSFEALVKAHDALVNSKEAEMRLYAASIQAENAKVQNYEAEVRAFSARVAAFGTTNQVNIQRFMAEMELENLKYQSFDAELKKAQTSIQQESERVRSLATLYSSDASIFAASGSIAMSEAEHNRMITEMAIRQNVEIADKELKSAELRMNELLQASNILAGNLQSRAQAASQLAAASWSAVNASASISESGSASNSWSDSFSIGHSYSYER